MLLRFLPAALAAACLAGPALAQGQKRPPDQDPSVRTQPAEPKKFPIDMQWTLVSLSGKAPPGDRPTLMVDGQFRVHGFGGCNSFSATSIPQPGQRFAVGPIAQTKRSCDKAVMDFERAFLIAYRTAVVWDIKDGFLMFGSQAGELKLERGL